MLSLDIMSDDFMELKKNHKGSNADLNNDNDDIYEDADTELFKSAKKKKKDKKKKKKKNKQTRYLDDKLDLLLGDSDEFGNDDFLTGDDIISLKKPKKGKKDMMDMKAAKKNRKKNIEAKFSPMLTNLRKILKDVEYTESSAREIFDNLRNSKARYVGKTMTDLISGINQSNSTRASIVKEMANINKAIIELQLKDGKNKQEKDKDVSGEEHGVQFFTKLFSGGNRAKLKEMAKDYYNSQDDYDEYDDDDAFDSYIDDRLANEENAYRSSKGNKYIEYENEKPEDCIFYYSDGSWDTGAVNKHGERMPDDYPLIPKENLGNVRFNLDEHKATDETGRLFRVIEIPD
jgi:hypothetical protein